MHRLFAPGSPTPAPGWAGCVSPVAINGVGFLAVPGGAGGVECMSAIAKYRRCWAVVARWIGCGIGRWFEGVGGTQRKKRGQSYRQTYW